MPSVVKGGREGGGNSLIYSRMDLPLVLLVYTNECQHTIFPLPGGCHISQWPSLPLCWHPTVLSQRYQPTFSAEKYTKVSNIIFFFLYMTVSLQEVTKGRKSSAAPQKTNFTFHTYRIPNIMLSY